MGYVNLSYYIGKPTKKVLGLKILLARSKGPQSLAAGKFWALKKIHNRWSRHTMTRYDKDIVLSFRLQNNLNFKLLLGFKHIFELYSSRLTSFSLEKKVVNNEKEVNYENNLYRNRLMDQHG